MHCAAWWGGPSRRLRCAARPPARIGANARRQDPFDDVVTEEENFGGEAAAVMVPREYSAPLSAGKAEQMVVRMSRGGMYDTWGFGVASADGGETHHVASVQAGTPSEGRLRQHDRIVAINGAECRGVPHDELVGRLVAGTEMTVVVLRLQGGEEPVARSPSLLRTEKLVRVSPGGPMGFGISTTVDCCVHLVGSVAGGPAAEGEPMPPAVGKLGMHDEVVAVDGEPVRGKSHEAVVALVKAAGETLTLTLDSRLRAL